VKRSRKKREGEREMSEKERMNEWMKKEPKERSEEKEKM
jgi:hypothetical protein